ncbi:hypothetical protein ACTXT7_005668 [Hymenolepis weldensis]
MEKQIESTSITRLPLWKRNKSPRMNTESEDFKRTRRNSTRKALTAIKVQAFSASRGVMHFSILPPPHKLRSIFTPLTLQPSPPFLSPPVPNFTIVINITSCSSMTTA